MTEGRSSSSRYNSFCDDYYVNMNLNTEMELPQTRETVLHFFEQVKKSYPGMKNFCSRERGEFVLEEDKDKGNYRWASIETRRVSSGYVNPPSVEDALKQHALILDLIPYTLSVSPLDCESLNVMYGFDYTYRGNHNQLMADAIGVIPAFEKMTEMPGATILASEPSIQFALDEDCRTQCRLSVETRTSAYHVRTKEFPEEQISVYFTARRYGSLDGEETYVAGMRQAGRHLPRDRRYLRRRERPAAAAAGDRDRLERIPRCPWRSFRYKSLEIRRRGRHLSVRHRTRPKLPRVASPPSGG